jgi:hypothetical protein
MCLLTLVGCGGDFGESTIPAGTYSGVFAELTANNWTIAPPNYRGAKLIIDATIGAGGFPVINGQEVAAGQTIRVTMSDLDLSEQILQVVGQGTRVTVSYSGTITENGVTAPMSGGYIIDWLSSLDALYYDETIYVGTTIPDETRATRIIRFNGELPVE